MGNYSGDIMEHIFNRNENTNNEIVTKIFIGLAAFIAAIWLFCRLGIFDFDMEAATLFLSISLVVLIVPVVLFYVFHIHGKYMKYVLITILALIMGLSYCVFTFQMVILFLTPSLVAALYMNKRLLYFSGIVSLLVVVGSHVITGFYVLQPWLEPFMGVENIIRFGAIPRIMQLGLCFSILVVLMNRMLSYMEQLKNVNDERISNVLFAGNGADVDKQEYDSYLELLTEREGDVFRQMLLGKTNIQIADTLCLSIGTVKNYVSSIYDKIGTKERNYLILKYGRFVADYDQSNNTL